MLFDVSDAASRVAGCVITEGVFARSGATCYRVMRKTAVVAEVCQLFLDPGDSSSFLLFSQF